MPPQHRVINVSFSWCSVLAAMTEGFELVYSHLFNPVSTEHITACGARKMDEWNQGHEGVRVMMSLDLNNSITHCSRHFRGHLSWGVQNRRWKNSWHKCTHIPCSWCNIWKQVQILTCTAPWFPRAAFSLFDKEKEKKGVFLYKYAIVITEAWRLKRGLLKMRKNYQFSISSVPICICI